MYSKVGEFLRFTNQFEFSDNYGCVIENNELVNDLYNCITQITGCSSTVFSEEKMLEYVLNYIKINDLNMLKLLDSIYNVKIKPDISDMLDNVRL